MTKLSEFISTINIRYTSPNANKKVLDRMVEEFTIEPKEKKEDTRNGAELIKDGVI